MDCTRSHYSNRTPLRAETAPDIPLHAFLMSPILTSVASQLSQHRLYPAGLHSRGNDFHILLNLKRLRLS
ncbi:protein YnhH [Siccibacter turicensis]|uniref:protein YnhH n=1 Tax=Siccibacter turicensis TaxID=357233 RepID=UPI003F558E95